MVARMTGSMAQQWALPGREFEAPQQQVRGPDERVMVDTRERAGCLAAGGPTATPRQLFTRDIPPRSCSCATMSRAPGGWAQTRQAPWKALARDAFVAHDIIADDGARCAALLPDGRTLQMGDEAPFAQGTVMSLSLPREAEIRWIVNGRCRLEERSDRISAIRPPRTVSRRREGNRVFQTPSPQAAVRLHCARSAEGLM
jgi:hypothetical protein